MVEIFGVSTSEGQLQLSFVVWHLGQQSQEAVSFRHQKQHVHLVADSLQVVQQLHKPLTLDSLQIGQHVQFPCSSRVLFILQVLQICANWGHSQFLTLHLQIRHLRITGYSSLRSSMEGARRGFSLRSLTCYKFQMFESELMSLHLPNSYQWRSFLLRTFIYS